MTVTSQNSSYRRGVILGLTMAEIFILVIFLLLLAFSDMLYREKEKNIALSEAMNNSNPRIATLIKSFSEQPPDMMDDVVGAVEELPEVVSFVKREALGNENEKVSATIMRAMVALKEAKDKDALPQAEAESIDFDKLTLPEAIEEIKVLQASSQNLVDQKKNLLSTLQASGKGSDYPPCWPDKDGRATEYLFSVDLTNGGILMADMAPAHRAELKSRLPLDRIKLNVHRTIPQFMFETEPLLKWSNDNECRFYVFVKDKTGSAEKALYKRQLVAVEGSFYKKISSQTYTATSSKTNKSSKSSNDQPVADETETELEKNKTVFQELFGGKATRKIGEVN